MNENEIQTLIANEIRNMNLNDAIDLDGVKKKVMEKIHQLNNSSEEISEMENPAVAQGPTEFPYEEEEEEDRESFQAAPKIASNEPTQKIGRESGSDSLTGSTEPKRAIVPEVPDFLKEVEPEKVFIYDTNELSVGGENLSNKPFKTLRNPEVSKSLQQMWSEKGVTKAEVYQAKFEKIGDIVFDYKNGTSQFIEKRFDPDLEIQNQYQENPYSAEPTKEIEQYINNNIDINQKINDVITNIVKNYFLTNSERAVNDNTVKQNEENIQTQNSSLTENKKTDEDINLKKIINEFKKIETPSEILKLIEGKKSKASLVYENEEIKKWKLDNQDFYLPANPLSVKMCYVKK
jgi:hypothetical protein